MVNQKKIVEKFRVEREFELDGTNTYCLYDNKEQDNLLTMAYSEEEVKEESKFYSSGVWFVGDNTIDSNMVLNERRYKKRIKFPDKPEKRPSYHEIQEEIKLNSKWGDLR